MKVLASEGFTYQNGKKRTLIDYFVVSNRIVDLTAPPEPLYDANISPHKPVKAVFKGGYQAQKITTTRVPKQFPLRRPIGPPPAPPCWELYKSSVSCALESSGLDTAADRFFRLAEKEFCGVHGIPVASQSPYLGRGTALSLVTIPLVPPSKDTVYAVSPEYQA